MTTDHWIQIAAIVTNSITALAVVVLGARMNQSKPKVETTKQPAKTWIGRFFTIPLWLYFLFIGANILFLIYDSRNQGPISFSYIVWIADRKSVV